MKSHDQLPRAWFVAGTDTEVGKTFSTCALLHKGQQQGLRVAGLKPVAAGTNALGHNEDVEAIRLANSVTLPESILNPYLFSDPIAPHIAAQKEGVEIHFPPILASVEQAMSQVDMLLVEGVGGFRVPLGKDGDSADLAQALGLPIILIVGMRLGCINHALLTVEAIAQRQILLAGWIANCITPGMNSFHENIETLSQLITAPLLGVVPHSPSGRPSEASHALQLPW
ncbi:MAG: dethiobiotin synthase [Azovibrio sp.]